MYHETKIRMTADFSLETMQAKQELPKNLKIAK
jgi:hypothetical protein